MACKAVTLAERRDLEGEFARFAELGWPRFLRQHDELGHGPHWPSLYTAFADFQLYLLEGHRVVAVGHAIPIPWDRAAGSLPDSIAGIFRLAGETSEGRCPTALAALAAIIDPPARGRGLSAEVLKAMTAIARQHGLGALVAPVRPTLKAAYPLAPMERFVRWTRPDGAPVDPWLRTHWRLGAEIGRVMPRALVIVGGVADWEDWTDMVFPDSGAYVVPGALQPVQIDREKNEGRYEDPNVWMHHRIQ